MSISAFSQSTLRTIKIVRTDTVKLNAIVVPQTIVVLFKEIDKNLEWKWDENTNAVILSEIPKDTVTLLYRESCFTAFLKDTSKQKPLIVPVNPDNRQNLENRVGQGQTDIIKKGTFERSVSVGNNQNPVLRSKMNLILQGKLSDNLLISAKLNDNHIPVNPDGNTARINDIDEININVYNDDFSLQAGDIQVDNNSGFLVYKRQIKGLFYQKNIDSIHFYNVGFAVSKGKYTRQTVKPVEGVQGPYKLNGANGETFIMILPASEKIWIDGNLLKPGQNNDYTIDYNTAEITFTAKRPITKDSRIIAEFQYRQRDYASFLTVANAKMNVGNREFYASFYNRKDAVNQTIDYDLNDTAKQILYNAGDNPQLAVIPAVDSVPFDSDKILYEKVDTIISGQKYEFFRYSVNPATAFYDVHFVYVGTGAGDYVIDESIVNGRVYKWISPDGKRHRGDYDIYRNLIAPEKHIVGEIGGQLLANQNDTLFVRLAVSQFDKNLFSPLDDNDNTGVAFAVNNRLMLVNALSVKRFADFDYEYTGKNFAGIDRFRPTEFERDWNLDSLLGFSFHSAGFSFSQLSENLIVNSGLKLLVDFEKFTGLKPFVKINRVGEKWDFFVKNSSLFTFSSYRKTFFLRNEMSTSYHNNIFRTGFIFSQELNRRKKLADLQLDTLSQMFNQAGIFFQSTDSSQFFYNFSYNRRFDFLPSGEFLKYASYSDNFELKTRKNGNFHYDFIANYRNLKVLDSALLFLRSKKSLNLFFTSSYSFFKNAVTQNFTLKFSNAMEPQMQFVYIEVEPSLGNYKWLDFNNDGIAQTDEFVPAYFSDEANYRRVAVQTNKYVATFYKSISVGQVFSPEKLFAENSTASRLFSHIQNTTSLKFDYKSQSSDISILSMDSALLYMLYFSNFLHSSVNAFNFDYTITESSQKQFLVSGNDFSNLQENVIVLSYKSGNWLLLSKYKLQTKKSSSDYSQIKNYSLSGNFFTAEMRYEKEKFTTIISYEYSQNKNLQGDEILFSNKLSIINNVSLAKKMKLKIESEIIKNNFSGVANSTAAYVMLQGFKNGMNYRWLLAATKNLTKFMNFRLEYSGRYSESGRVIHTGSVGLVAYF